MHVSEPLIVIPVAKERRERTREIAKKNARYTMYFSIFPKFYTYTIRIDEKYL